MLMPARFSSSIRLSRFRPLVVMLARCPWLRARAIKIARSELRSGSPPVKATNAQLRPAWAGGVCCHDCQIGVEERFATGKGDQRAVADGGVHQKSLQNLGCQIEVLIVDGRRHAPRTLEVASAGHQAAENPRTASVYIEHFGTGSPPVLYVIQEASRR